MPKLTQQAFGTGINLESSPGSGAVRRWREHIVEEQIRISAPSTRSQTPAEPDVFGVIQPSIGSSPGEIFNPAALRQSKYASLPIIG